MSTPTQLYALSLFQTKKNEEKASNKNQETHPQKLHRNENQNNDQ